ncbi:MAG TPA: DUF4388 domain-containing protein [Thermomicrobiaceae bacterium]|nr:DUF4388 domain-containing protein [Thermomicrobiaceae bacterium]
MAFGGDLKDLPLEDILYVIANRGMSGRLTLTTSADEVLLAFEHGHVASVTTSDESLRIGRMLVDQGFVSEDDLEQALALQEVEAGRSRLGDILVDLRLSSPEQISRAVAAQFEGSLYRILIQPGGSFVFASGEPGWEISPFEDFPIEPMVLNAMRRADEWLARHANQAEVEIADIPIVPTILDRLSDPERDVTLALLNGETSVWKLAAATNRSIDEVETIVAQLAALGLVNRLGGSDEG